eukprot:gnl/TRDRNA2_/TRDRNA2_41030_c0_seq1.p1 gnl/TRDRNA2_/TRDRNA2_41030_c0~~gnl/TRDRNA2_/TRDRNA2_41030_c0_seq1.p1  ORF type:complete len:414 (+),score=61.27 gnl/TRDRNA2_/TRDRNA2_41030_c0_seq1:72-1244(+)
MSTFVPASGAQQLQPLGSQPQVAQDAVTQGLLGTGPQPTAVGSPAWTGPAAGVYQPLVAGMAPAPQASPALTAPPSLGGTAPAPTAFGMPAAGAATQPQQLQPFGLQEQQAVTQQLLNTGAAGANAGAPTPGGGGFYTGAGGGPLLGGALGGRADADAATRQLLKQDDPTRRDGLQQRKQSNVTARASERAAAAEEATCFRLMFTGQIESAQLGAGVRSPLMCVFSVQHGADWTVVSGAPHGITQLACSSSPAASSFASMLVKGHSREVVWNFPLGLVFKSTSPFGWPRIVVSVYGTDLCNRRVIKGYGSVHIPCQPGKHTRTIRLYCPLSSSPLTRLLGALTGNPAQLVDPRLLAGTEGREVIRVQSGGKVKLTFDVLLKDTETFNYAF